MKTMTKWSLLTGVVILTGLFLTSREARADDCLILGGVPDIPTNHCHVPNVVTLPNGGTFNLTSGLHIHATGGFIVPPGKTLTINIAGGAGLEMEVGAKISGNVTTTTGTGATIDLEVSGDILLHGNGSTGALVTSTQSAGSCNGGKGGKITLHADGAINTQAGSVISVNGTPCSAGEIVITSGTAIDIDGQVLSESTLSGVGATQPPGGGRITIVAHCNLTIDDHGKVSSKGADPGADLVHLEGGCDVVIVGLVQSTSSGGHVTPNSPPNHCDGNFRPGKPANSIACIELVSGRNLTVGPPFGQVNADSKQGQSWIDVFVRGDILIDGDFAAATPYRFHADRVGATNETGGAITIESIAGTVSTTGKAIQANATGGGGKGGSVDVEAEGDAALTISAVGSSIQAKGATSGGAPAGGTIFIRSWTGSVTGTAGLPALGELNASGGGAFTGLVTLEACTVVNYSGTVTPSPAVILQPVCVPGAPPLPAYIVSFLTNIAGQLPVCACGCACVTSFETSISTDPTLVGTTSGKVGDTVTINGAGLNSVTQMRFASTCDPASGTVAVILSPKTDTTISVTVPAGLAPGFYEIITICPTGSYCTQTKFQVK